MRSASKRSLISESFAIWTRRVAIESSGLLNFVNFILLKGIRGGTGMGELQVCWERRYWPRCAQKYRIQYWPHVFRSGGEHLNSGGSVRPWKVFPAKF